MEYYLGLIKYRPNTKWFEIYKLIKAKDIIEAESKLKKWADKSVADRNVCIIITECL
jgi:membrane protein DedA with SNARE-associated domain